MTLRYAHLSPPLYLADKVKLLEKTNVAKFLPNPGRNSEQNGARYGK
jgi:hypothetical protein